MRAWFNQGLHFLFEMYCICIIFFVIFYSKSNLLGIIIKLLFWESWIFNRIPLIDYYHNFIVYMKDTIKTEAIVFSCEKEFLWLDKNELIKQLDSQRSRLSNDLQFRKTIRRFRRFWHDQGIVVIALIILLILLLAYLINSLPYIIDTIHHYL